MKDRYYVAKDEYGNLLSIGWNLAHEPTPDNECGYEIEAGPFEDIQEAKDYIAEARA